MSYKTELPSHPLPPGWCEFCAVKTPAVYRRNKKTRNYIHMHICCCECGKAHRVI